MGMPPAPYAEGAVRTPEYREDTLEDKVLTPEEDSGEDKGRHKLPERGRHRKTQLTPRMEDTGPPLKGALCLPRPAQSSR